MQHPSSEFTTPIVEPIKVDLDFRRIGPLLQIGACLGVTVALLVGGLLLLHRCAPGLFPPRLAGLGYAEEIQGRVDAAVLAERASGDAKLCAIVGFSGGQEGIDVVQLAEDDDIDCRYLGLCGACDGTIGGLRELIQPLYQSQLRTDLMVIAMNPFHLVVRPHNASLRRSDIKHGVDMRLLSGRRQVLDLVGIGVDPRYQRVDPWRPMTKNYFDPVPEAVLKLRVSEYGARGYFDLANYDVQGTQSRHLARLIEAMRDRGTEVAIVLMPVHTALFRHLPQNATDTLRTALGRELPGPLPLILDYQESVQERGFHDGSHLNGAGRAQFTSMLAAELTYLLNQPAR